MNTYMNMYIHMYKFLYHVSTILFCLRCDWHIVRLHSVLVNVVSNKDTIFILILNEPTQLHADYIRF